MRNAIIDKIDQASIAGKKEEVVQFRAGDTVKVHYKVPELNGKFRIQAYQGTVIRYAKGTIDSTFTVRKMSDGIGVERTFPTYSILIDHIELISLGRVRRSRLYYLRDRRGKAARITQRYVSVAKKKKAPPSK